MVFEGATAETEHKHPTFRAFEPCNWQRAAAGIRHA
jgi:hypothetical protein